MVENGLTHDESETIKYHLIFYFGVVVLLGRRRGWADIVSVSYCFVTSLNFLLPLSFLPIPIPTPLGERGGGGPCPMFGKRAKNTNLV